MMGKIDSSEQRETDTAEVHAMTYILPGKGPMTFEELVAHQQKDAAAEEAMARDIADDNARREAKLAAGETIGSDGG